MTRSNRRKLGLTLLAGCLGLLATEGLVRLSDQRAVPFPAAKGSLFTDVKHPVLMFVNRPNAKKVIEYDEGGGNRWSVTMRTNGQRFRGAEVQEVKPEGVTRVACLGDSHTWGDGVREEESWPAQLRALARPGVEVLNCGVNGYDTLQEVLWYERFVEPFDPDIVLLAYFPNDVSSRGLGKLGGRIQNDRLTSWTHPRRPGFVRTMRETSVAIDLLCDRIYRWRSLQTRQDSWSARYNDEDPGWRRARDAMLRLKKQCDRDGRELRVLLFPYLVPAADVFESHEVLKIVAGFCRAQGIEFFDAEPALLAVLDEGDPASLRVSASDFHANGKAYGAFAAATAKWLDETGLPIRAD